MTPRSEGRAGHAAPRLLRGLIALAVALALAIPAAATTATTANGPAALRATGSVTFGTPTATPRFGTGVDFTQPVTTSGLRPRRVELLITLPGELGPESKQLASTGDLASATLRYTLLESDRHIYPNTTISARWRIVDGNGAEYEGPSVSLVYADTRFDWKTVSGPLVRVHWYVGDSAFGQRALAIGEGGVAKAEKLLGVTETEPVDFYVYADQGAFYDALGPGTRENVGGVALSEIRTLFALITPGDINDSWVGIVIPHELTHLVFNTAVENPFHFPPRWLNEGLAVYLSQGNDAGDRAQVSAAARNRTIIPLTGLTAQFPTTRDQFSLAYAESVSAVDFIIRQYSSADLVKLIVAYKSGVTDDEALARALGLDSKALDAAWLADIGAPAPVAVGPQPDPPGPLPAGWSSTPENAAPGATGASGTSAINPSGSATPGAATTAAVPVSAGPSGSTPGSASATSTLAAAAATNPRPTSSVVPAEASPPELPAEGTAQSGLLGLGIVAILALGLGAVFLARRRPGERP